MLAALVKQANRAKLHELLQVFGYWSDTDAAVVSMDDGDSVLKATEKNAGFQKWKFYFSYLLILIFLFFVLERNCLVCTKFLKSVPFLATKIFATKCAHKR